MRVIMLVANQNAFACSPHAMLFVMLLKPFQARSYRRILLGLLLLRPERVIAQGIQAK